MTLGIDYKRLFNSSKATATVTGLDLVAAELNLLLNFKKHELFFGNNMGLDLEKYISLTNRTATFNLIKNDIEELFRKYRRATLKKIEMQFVSDKREIQIDLVVSVDKYGNNTFNIPLIVSN